MSPLQLIQRSSINDPLDAGRDLEAVLLFGFVQAAVFFHCGVRPQGGIGKAGAPGEIGPQGFPVSMTFAPELSVLTVIGCT